MSRTPRTPTSPRRPLPSLWLIIPAYRRYDVTRASFPQLRWSLDQLKTRHGIDGHAVVVADDHNLVYATGNGFDTLEAANEPLGRKWNDGYQYAAEHGADYLVPCGTDDWIDPDYLALLPGPNDIRASRWATAVSEDGRELIHFNVNYTGGDGIRILPRRLLEPCRFRPAEEDRARAIDTSVFRTVTRTCRGFRFVYAIDDPLSIVQFQSHGLQLNPYAALKKRFPHQAHTDVWERLGARYEARFVAAAQRMYAARA